MTKEQREELQILIKHMKLEDDFSIWVLLPIIGVLMLVLLVVQACR